MTHGIVDLFEIIDIKDKQKALGAALVEEMKVMGITDAHMDENGYVYGKNGAGFVTRGTGSRQLFSVSYYQEHLKNVYVLLDTWVEPEQESTTAT